MELKTASHGIQRVFPLEEVVGDGHGYFITSAGTVFITRQGTLAQMLIGTPLPGDVDGILNREYSVSGQYCTRASLLRLAKNSVSWNYHMVAEETAPTPDIDKAPSNRSYGTVAQGLASNGAVIARVSGTGAEAFLEFGSKPKIHLTPESLKSEMTRLATANPCVRYVALKIGQSVLAGGVVWS